MRVFGFIRQGVELYLPLEKVRGIFQDENIYRYPEISNRVFGLLFIGGEVVPVVDFFKIIMADNSFENIQEYSVRCSVVLADSASGMIAFVYDELRDIFEKEALMNLKEFSVVLKSSDIRSGAFFVENTEILEDIILGIRLNISRFKEILLCPKKY